MVLEMIKRYIKSIIYSVILLGLLGVPLSVAAQQELTREERIKILEQLKMEDKKIEVNTLGLISPKTSIDIEKLELPPLSVFLDAVTENALVKIPDIILVEYPAVSTATLPMPVLKKADFNLLIANAARLWGRDDDTRLKPLKEELEGTPLFMYLNNADREVVESFTGELPPHTPVHSFFSRLAQLGLTSKSAAVK